MKAVPARSIAILGALVISFSAIFFRLADVSNTTASFHRPFLALPVLFAIAFAQHQRGRPGRPARERWLTVAAGGMMGIAFIFWNFGIEALGAGLATVLGNSQVVFVGLSAWLLHGERPSRAALIGIPVVLLGAMATSGLGGAEAYGSAPLRGVVFGLANGVTYAAFLVMFRALNRGAGLAAGLLADASLGAALVAAAAGVLADPGFTLIPEATAAFWLIMAALGPQVVGWLAILYALPRLAALDTSVVLLLQPVLTVLWAWWLLAETPSAIQLGGVALVLVGVTIVSSFGSTKRRTERKAADSGGAP